MPAASPAARPEPVSRRPYLVLRAETAAELMAPDPVSIRDGATVQEALLLFTDGGVEAAPVIDEAGRPVGVLGRTDLLTHYRELMASRPDSPANRPASDPTLVRDLMTPAVFSVTPEATASEVVEQMVGLKLQRLFVVQGGTLVGVISAWDVLRRLRT